jgi:hypothetical protein
MRRWCWIEPWSLSEQDESLNFITGDCPIGALLEEAQAGAPKAAYAVRIVEHRIRDRTHGFLCEGHKCLPRHLEEISSVESMARSCGFAELAGYCARLATYWRRAPVEREEAIARAMDLRRCAPAPPEQIIENDGYFTLCMDGCEGKWLVVGRKDGQMRVKGLPPL